jgi:hypothetical protein
LLSPIRLLTIGLALCSVAAAPPARARVAAGQTLENVELPTFAGGKESLLSKSPVNIILFWRPNHERSLDTLRQMAECEKAFAGKPIHMVAVVSGTYPADEVKISIIDAGLHVPVLIDEGDALYGKLEIRQHPLVVVTDGNGSIQVAQPYVKLRYCDIIRAHVKYLLKEIDAAQLHAVLNPPRSAFPSDDKNNIVRRFVKMGRREIAAGRCDKALHSFGQALEIEPSDKDALAGVAACDPSKASVSKK